jgi:hypothetical protein
VAPTLDQVRTEVTRLADAINAPAQLLPTFGHSKDLARPCIEADGGDLSWIVVERGEELVHQRQLELLERLNVAWAER